jgi:hypothetical protein
MKHALITGLFLLAILSLAPLEARSSPAKPVENPRAYAERISQAYAEGDSGDSSGFAGCESLEEVSGLHILCEGSRSVLVHGGHMHESPFACDFIFQESSDGTFSIAPESESCY